MSVRMTTYEGDSLPQLTVQQMVACFRFTAFAHIIGRSLRWPLCGGRRFMRLASVQPPIPFGRSANTSDGAQFPSRSIDC
jgi:hypothetical protein